MMKFRRRRMRLRKPIKRWKLVVVVVLLVALVMTVQTFVFIEYNLRPAFIQIAENYTRKIATETINDAITKKVSEETRYEELVQFNKDTQGTIRTAQFNLVEASRMKAQLTNHVQGVLRELEKQEIQLPIGQALHSTILATFSPTVPITIVPMGTAKSDMLSTSETLGINQTKHVLSLDIQVQVNVISPFVTPPVDIHTKIPIATIMMVGEVPQVFLDAKGASFVPSGVPSYQVPPLSKQEE